jgi:hypothetical protein
MATRFGTSGTDQIIGTELDDFLYGYAPGQKGLDIGNDRIFGGKGRDFISRSLESVVLILIQVEAAAVTAQANCSYCTSTGPTVPVHPGESLFHCKARP